MFAYSAAGAVAAFLNGGGCLFRSRQTCSACRRLYGARVWLGHFEAKPVKTVRQPISESPQNRRLRSAKVLAALLLTAFDHGRLFGAKRHLAWLLLAHQMLATHAGKSSALRARH